VTALLWTLAALAAIGPALSWLLARKNFRDAPDLAAEPPLEPAREPSLLVLVPARDEAAQIGACVRALLASRYGNFRVRVVDDASSDGTAEAARAAASGDPRLEVVAAPPLPPGWLGKSHALWSGAQDAEAEWLLFADADLRVEPEAIGRAIAAGVRRDAALVTVLPRVVAESFWEVAAQVQIATYVIAWIPSREVNDPASPRSVGIGPFLLFRRSAYQEIGGHQAVRADVVEDARLAERVKRAGKRIAFLRGVDLLSVRMYRDLAGIVRGFQKNFHEMIPPVAAPLAAAAALAFLAGPWIVPIAAAAARAWGPAALAATGCALAVGLRLDLQRSCRLTARAPWLAPLGALVIAWILVVGAARRALGRGVAWKGRRVA
jgi:glycosyltransferase involved in cell wall biosynthesis